MVRHLYSKVAIAIYIIIAIGLAVWGFMIFKDRDGKVVVNTPLQSQQSVTNTDEANANSSDPSTSTQNNADTNTPTDNPADGSSSTPTQAPVDNTKNPISPTPDVSGPMLAHITTEHCDTGCKAFAADLVLFEYCEQVCGISPIKNVSNCDDKKDVQKDYCLKDFAIGKQDASLCDKIKDANIKQTCVSMIEQTIEENQRRDNPQSAPAF